MELPELSRGKTNRSAVSFARSVIDRVSLSAMMDKYNHGRPEFARNSTGKNWLRVRLTCSSLKYWMASCKVLGCCCSAIRFSSVLVRVLRRL